MCKPLARLAALAFVLFPFIVLAQKQPDALKLLDAVTKQYADATSYRIEAVKESRSTTDLSSYWTKEVLKAEEAPGKRYRFEGRTHMGSGFVVSDGKTEWNLHYPFNEYTRRPAGSYGHPFPKLRNIGDDAGEENAYFLRRPLAMTADSAKAAHFLHDQTIHVGGHRVKCYVVTFGSEDLRNPSTFFGKIRQTFWIDKKRSIIVKSLFVGDFKQPYDPKRVAPHPILLHTEVTTLYPVVQLNDTLPESDFSFTPPPDAAMVKDFAPPFGVRLMSAPKVAKLPNMVDKMEPWQTFHAADGSPFRLESLRGHPVLLDLWATWCGPCLIEMPAIDSIYRRTKDTGLVVIGLDIDKDASTAPDFMKRKGYGWADYHVDMSKGYGLPNTGVPLLVLIDESGKIVYYHDGADDQPGLLNAIKQLGPAYANAIHDKN